MLEYYVVHWSIITASFAITISIFCHDCRYKLPPYYAVPPITRFLRPIFFHRDRHSSRRSRFSRGFNRLCWWYIPFLPSTIQADMDCSYSDWWDYNLPILYALLENKSTLSYQTVLEFLHNRCTQSHSSLTSKRLSTMLHSPHSQTVRFRAVFLISANVRENTYANFLALTTMEFYQWFCAAFTASLLCLLLMFWTLLTRSGTGYWLYIQRQCHGHISSTLRILGWMVLGTLPLNGGMSMLQWSTGILSQTMPVKVAIMR